MTHPERLHSLDALRAGALLLGVVLHASQPYLGGGSWMVFETPSKALGLLAFTIHLFRMPVFFLIAGFFARMLLERRGLRGFLKDRSRRILLPLVAGVPLIMLLTGLVYMLGALAAGQPLTMPAPPPAAHPAGVLTRINLIHLWFIYYLLLFYAAALIARSVCNALSRASAPLRAALNIVARGLMRAPVILSLPVIVYWSLLPAVSWRPWPAHVGLLPNVTALLGFGAFFGFGWLLNRQVNGQLNAQQDLLAGFSRRCGAWAGAALILWLVCRQLGAATGAGHLAAVCYAWRWMERCPRRTLSSMRISASWYLPRRAFTSCPLQSSSKSWHRTIVRTFSSAAGLCPSARKFFSIRGSLEPFTILLDWFTARPTAKPDFAKLAMADYGHTVRFGEYEAATDCMRGVRIKTR